MMGTRRTDLDYIGIILHDDRVAEVNMVADDGTTAGSDYTENTARPGVPEYDRALVATAMTPDRGPQAALDTLGDQDATTSYHMQVLDPGMPGDSEATIAMRPALTTAQRWRGWNSHNVLDQMLKTEHIETLNPGGNNEKLTGSCRTADNQVCFVFVKAAFQVKSRRYDPETHTMSAEVVVADKLTDPTVDTAGYPASETLPDVIKTDSGRLICYYTTLYEDPVGTNHIKVGWSYSDDDGKTWRVGGFHATDNFHDATKAFIRLRAAYHGGQVLLLIQWRPDHNDGQEAQTVDVWLQYASDDDGATLQLVDSGLDHLTGTHPNTGPQQKMSEIVVDRATGIFTVIYRKRAVTSGTETVETKRIASPFHVLHHVNDTLLAATLPTDMTAWGDQDGYLYYAYSGASFTSMHYSVDGGASWNLYEFSVTKGTGAPWTRITAACAAGQTVWAMCEPTTAYASGERYFFVSSGGWSTVTQPRATQIIDKRVQNAGWGSGSRGEEGYTWFPPQLPTVYNWTSVGTGAFVVSATSPWEGVLTTTADTRYFHDTPAVPPPSHDGTLCTFQLKVDTAGDVASLKVGVEIRHADFHIEVRWSSTQVRLRDVVGAADITTVALTTSTETVYKLAADHDGTNARVALYYRTALTEDYQNLFAVSYVAGVGSGPGARIAWGSLVSGTETSRWAYFHYTMVDGDKDRHDELSFRDITTVAPFALTGAPIPAPPFKRYVDAGLFVTGTSGPFARGDAWKIEPHSDYPVEVVNPDVAPSPRRVWRSVDDSALVRLVWNVHADTDTSFGATSYGFGAFGVNVKTMRLRGWDGAAWTTLVESTADVQLSSCSYTRSGNRVTVDAAASPFNAGARWVHYDEFAGCTIDLGSGKLRVIHSNTEGSWTDETTKRPVLILDGVDGTEPASGQCSIWSSSIVGLVHENTAVYRRYAIEIPIQTTATGYFEVGTIVIGPVVFLGQKYSWGRNHALERALQITETRDRRRRVRKLAPDRRVVDVSWSEGVDTSPVHTASPDPRYISITSAGEPVASVSDTPTLVEGLLRRTAGSLGVLVPRIDDTPAGSLTKLAGQEDAILGIVPAGVSRSVVLGGENRDELVRIAGLTWSEEV